MICGGIGAGLAVAVLIRALYLAVSLVGAIYLPGILAALDTDRVVESEGK